MNKDEEERRNREILERVERAKTLPFEVVKNPPTGDDEILSVWNEYLGLQRRTIETAIRLGGLLQAKKDSMRKGQWLIWLASKDKGEDSAQELIRVYEHRDQIDVTKVKTLTEAIKLLRKPRVKKPEPEPKPPDDKKPEPETPKEKPQFKNVFTGLHQLENLLKECLQPLEDVNKVRLLSLLDQLLVDYYPQVPLPGRELWQDWEERDSA